MCVSKVLICKILAIPNPDFIEEELLNSPSLQECAAKKKKKSA